MTKQSLPTDKHYENGHITQNQSPHSTQYSTRFNILNRTEIKNPKIFYGHTKRNLLAKANLSRKYKVIEALMSVLKLSYVVIVIEKDW